MVRGYVYVADFANFTFLRCRLAKYKQRLQIKQSGRIRSVEYLRTKIREIMQIRTF